MTAAKHVTATRRLWIATGALSVLALPELGRALPALAGALTIGSVVFGPTGMQPADVADAADSSVLLRAGIWMAWLAAMAPTAVQLGRSEPSYHRWLPIPAPAFWLTRVLFLGLLNLPLALFWSFAASPIDGLAALSLCVAFHASLLVPRAFAVLIASLAFAGLVAPLPPAFSLAGALAAISLTVPWAWRRAHEGRGQRRMRVPRGQARSALAGVIGVELIDPLLASRALVAAIVFGGLAGLLIRVNDLSTASVRLLIAGAVALGSVGLAATVANRLTDSWRRLHWLLRSTNTAARAQTFAMSVTAAMAMIVVGIAVTGMAAAVAAVDLVDVVIGGALGVASGVSIGWAALAFSTRAAASKKTHSWVGAITCAAAIISLLIGFETAGFAMIPAAASLALIYIHERMSNVEVLP